MSWVKGPVASGRPGPTGSQERPARVAARKGEAMTRNWQLRPAPAGGPAGSCGAEELLWRGTYMDAFPDNVWYGAGWPWVGFTIWHLAPQLILGPRRGRAQFLA